MSWQELDADRRLYYAVMVEDDYSIQPDALFPTREAADSWIGWQKSLWTEEEENGINPDSEIYVLAVRLLTGEAWNSWQDPPNPE